MQSYVFNEENILTSDSDSSASEPNFLIPDNLNTGGTPLSGKDILDLSVLAKAWDNNPDKVRKFASKFLQSIQCDLVDICDALEKKDITKLKLLGHRTKSSARFVGAKRFSDLSLSLENIDESIPIEEISDIVSKNVSIGRTN